MKTKTKLLFLFFVLISIDQILKYFTNNPFCNKNIAWNIPVSPAIFYFAWIVIIAILVYTFFKSNDTSHKYLLVFILAGALSNMVDRLRFGCVVDYIDLKFFPVFNLADAYITVGVILFILVIAREHSDRGNPVPH